MSIFNQTPITTPRLKVLLYAYAGKGKTWLACANPRLKVLYLYTEKQCETTIAIVQKAGLIHPESEFIYLKNTQDFMSLRDKIEKNLSKFNLLVFDTIDDYEEMASSEIGMVNGVKTAAACEDFGRSAASRDAEVQYLGSWLRNIDIHVLALAHPLESSTTTGTGKNKITKTRMELRFAGKKNSDTLAQKFNAVAQLDVRKTAAGTERKLIFRGPSNWLLKDLPYFDDQEPADFTALLEKHRNFYRVTETQKANEINEKE